MARRKKPSGKSQAVVATLMYAPYVGQEVTFGSIKEAARWVMADRPMTAFGQIRAVLVGEQKTAYMCKWRKA